MVALKKYSPQSLGFNPFQIATELAKPIDYDGTLRELQNWNNLANGEAATSINQAKADEAQQISDFNDKRQEAMANKIAEGTDPLQIDEADIEKTIGNVAGYLQIKKAQDEEKQKQTLGGLNLDSKLASIIKNQPEYGMSLAESLGRKGFRVPEQKSKGGDGEAKKVKPQIVIKPDTGEARVENASEDGFIPLDLVQKAQGMGIDLSSKSKATPAPQEGPGIIKQSMDFISSLTGGSPSATPGPVATPGAMQRPPPGHLLVRDKVTGEVKIIKK